jgi:hypothetical protein
VAAIAGDTLYTSDPSDLNRLLIAYGKRRPSLVTC